MFTKAQSLITVKHLISISPGLTLHIVGPIKSKSPNNSSVTFIALIESAPAETADSCKAKPVSSHNGRDDKDEAMSIITG